MATIIDALVVTLGLDGAGFKKGAKDVSSAQAKLKSDVEALEAQIVAAKRKSANDQNSIQKGIRDLDLQIAKVRAGSTAETKKQDAARIAALRVEQVAKRNALADGKAAAAAQIKSYVDVLTAKRKGLKDTETGEKDQLQRQKAQAEGLDKIKGALLGLLGVVAVATTVKAVVGDLFNLAGSDAALGRFAANFGVSAGYVSALGAAIKSVSGNAQEAQSTIAKMAGAAFGLKTGRVDPTQLGAYSRLGISAADLNDPSEALRKAAKTAETMPKQQFFQYALAAGIDPGTATALEKGQKSWDALIAKYTAAQKLTDAQIEKDQAFVSSLVDLGNAIVGVGRDLLGMVPPEVTDAIEWLSQTGIPALESEFETLSGPVTALGDAFNDLWTAIFGHNFNLKDLFGGDDLGEFFRELGYEIQFIAATIRAVADEITALKDLLKGDFKGADAADEASTQELKNALGYQLQALNDKPRASGSASGFAGGNEPGGGAASGGAATASAASVIKSFEGFKSNAYFDRNAYRVGYGSDTITDPVTGKVTKVTAGTTGVTKAQADADLTRRINTEFMPRVIQQVGAAAWAKLSAQAKAALVSNAYNYGSLQSSVANAARTGDSRALANAIASQAGQNGGINAGRRAREAQLAAGGSLIDPGITSGAQAAYAGNNVNNSRSASITNDVVINGGINVNVPGGSNGQAIGQAVAASVRTQPFVAQANTGLG